MRRGGVGVGVKQGREFPHVSSSTHLYMDRLSPLAGKCMCVSVGGGGGGGHG